MCLRLRWTKFVVISKVATQSKSTFKCFSRNPLHAHLPFSQQTLIEFHSQVQIMITNNKSVVFWKKLVSTKEWGIAPWCGNLKAWQSSPASKTIAILFLENSCVFPSWYCVSQCYSRVGFSARRSEARRAPRHLHIVFDIPIVQR